MQRKISIPISLKKATKIIAISEFTRSDILHNYKINSEKIFAIYNYFNFNKYTFLEKMDIDIDVRDPYILSVSSLAKHKNIIVILKAFNEICKKTDHILIFVGSLQKMCFNDRNYYEKLEESVKKRIVFFDKISNGSLAFLYKNCSFFVTATLFEGLGMPIIEALYFNAPTVVSDIEVLREITLNKVFYFDPRSSVALVQLLEKYKYNIPRPYMQNDIIEIFSEKNTSQKYIGIINDI
jgi:glycosyltransferase involved in cell wall biosynthesis